MDKTHKIDAGQKEIINENVSKNNWNIIYSPEENDIQFLNTSMCICVVNL